jgi:hypothetical protein
MTLTLRKLAMKWGVITLADSLIHKELEQLLFRQGAPHDRYVKNLKYLCDKGTRFPIA